MNVMDHKSCQEKLQKTKLGRFFILNKLFLCAGGEVDIDMCTVNSIVSSLRFLAAIAALNDNIGWSECKEFQQNTMHRKNFIEFNT